jgi:SagB-type dehydrogenase family enzyme
VKNKIVETDYYFALGNSQANFSYIDVVQRFSMPPNAFVEILVLVSSFIDNLDSESVFLVNPKDRVLAFDFQSIGFNFIGYLDSRPGGEEYALVDGACGANIFPYATWLSDTMESKTPLRLVLKFSGNITYDHRLGAKFNIDFFRQRERFLVGLTKIPRYEDSQKTMLNRKLPESIRTNDSFEEVISNRRSADGFTGRQISLMDINGILNDSYLEKKNGKRAFGAAGGFGQHTIHLIVKNIPEFSSGIYLLDESLIDWTPKNLSLDLNHINLGIFNQSSVAGFSAALVLSFDLSESIAKYGTRSFRFAFLNSGGLIQGMHLSAESRGVEFRMIGGFDDLLIANLLDIKSQDEVVTGICFLG